LHWDGASWAPVAARADTTFEDVLAISPTDVWAIGFDAADAPVALHWDGAAWKKTSVPGPSTGFRLRRIGLVPGGVGPLGGGKHLRLGSWSLRGLDRDVERIDVASDLGSPDRGDRGDVLHRCHGLVTDGCLPRRRRHRSGLLGHGATLGWEGMDLRRRSTGDRGPRHHGDARRPRMAGPARRPSDRRGLRSLMNAPRDS
jgi:hypothetical protein